MVFAETALQGAFVVTPEPIDDERGSFARIWCRREFAAHGLEPTLAQSSVSFNKRAGTLRGMHYQTVPFEETKLVRCTAGALFDVIIDLRPESPTLTRHFSVVLSAANRTMLYVPRGFAHGYQTLEDNTEVEYQISAFYEPSSARGVRWDDPAFSIEWPATAYRIMSPRDAAYPDYAGPFPRREHGIATRA
jgi:dTDP-4-dehydrorhamnose 3,5-epimerase